jgi:putative oxidoreductase
MYKLPAINKAYTFIILRATMGVIFITHGLARLYHGTVPGFGGYLESEGFPLGIAIAWVITIGEIISGTLMALGIQVKYCVLFHAIIILTGVFLIHLPQGWFTVGMGTGGVEYSLLILAVLGLIYSHAEKD